MNSNSAASTSSASGNNASSSSTSAQTPTSLIRRGALALGKLGGLGRGRKQEQQERQQVQHQHQFDSDDMVDPIFDYQFRLILIGDSTVGKSSLLRHFTDGTFAEVSDPTVGVDFFARVVRVDDGARIKLQLWDTAGQERFRSITKSYYRNSVGALLVYDICNADSFKHIPVWMMEAKRHIEPHKAIFILVGCKFDLTATNSRAREVSVEEARAFADSHDIDFVETSAKSGFNVEEAFQCLTQKIYDKIKSGEYQLEDGWDGIKKGFFGGTSAPSSMNALRNRSRSGAPLLEAEVANNQCC